MSFLLGILVWSWLHYWGHRLWHRYMQRGWRGGMLTKEVAHHVHFDQGGDEDRRHIAFPWEMWLYATGIASLLWLVSVWAAVGVLVGVTVDDLAHRQMHGHRWIWGWFRRAHASHHQTHATHFAMVTGAVWDWMFGTWA